MTSTAQQQSALQPAAGDARHVRIAIIGAGFSGLGMAIRLKQQGMDDFVVLERAADLGGTWRDNTYPGCACDVPSHLYSFSFALNPDWSRTFASQAEIWDYLQHCADRFGIRPHIRWNHDVLDAAWDAAAGGWRITTSQGTFAATVVIAGQGPLSDPALPTIPGLETFAGTRFHSAQWNHAHDLRGERVAVIGTGASAIQFVPRIQPAVGHLVLFQRTPPWIIPRNDRAIPGWRRALYHALPFTQRVTRTALYLQREFNALGLTYQPGIMRRAERLTLGFLAAQVPDPVLRAKLTPNYRMGCKRILLADDFYPSLQQPNVEVVTDAIREVRPRSIVTADGAERAIDTIICATGFRVTDSPIAGRIRGRDGQTLAAAWRDGMEAYLGTAVAGFPNLFLLIGPNTGLGHTSMIIMIEAQIAYIRAALRTMDWRGASALEVRPDAQAAYNADVQRRLGGTIWASGCRSWYLDARGRNSTIWPGFTWAFRRRTKRFDATQFEVRASIPQHG